MSEEKKKGEHMIEKIHNNIVVETKRLVITTKGEY